VLGAPVAVDDTVDVKAGTRTIDIPVLANDSDADTTSLATKRPVVRLVTLPTHGTAVVQANGSVRYTPANPSVVGEDTFTYLAIASHPSNVATVTVITTQPLGGPTPIATGDGPFAVRASTMLSLSVATLLANDVPNGASIAPASFTLVGPVTGGTATVANGQVAYTAGGVAGPGSFQYTIASITGVPSAPATVRLTVLPAADTLDIVNARFRTSTRRWDVTGTAAVHGPGNVVMVVLVRNGNVTGTVGTAQVDVAGAWRVRALLSNVRAQTGDMVRATSTAGGIDTLAVNVTH